MLSHSKIFICSSKSLIKSVADYAKIGLHPSYFSIKNDEKLNVMPIDARIFHYGWVKHPKDQQDLFRSQSGQGSHLSWPILLYQK